MDYAKKKEELVKQYNQNAEMLQRLSVMNQQILGQLQLLDELEKGDRPAADSENPGMEDADTKSNNTTEST